MNTNQRMRLVNAALEAQAREASEEHAEDEDVVANIDALVLERLVVLLPRHDGALPMSVRLLRVLWEEPDYPGDRAVNASLDRLIASGALKLCLVMGEPHVTTAGHLHARARQLLGPGVTHAAGSAARPVQRSLAPRVSLQPDDAEPQVSEAELFELQVALDVEHERALMYRVFVVLEVLGLLLLAREFMVRWLGLS